MVTPYQKGYKFEYDVKRMLEKKGMIVERMHASKGGADLKAADLDNQELWLLQLKLHNKLVRADRIKLKKVYDWYSQFNYKVRAFGVRKSRTYVGRKKPIIWEEIKWGENDGL